MSKADPDVHSLPEENMEASCLPLPCPLSPLLQQGKKDVQKMTVQNAKGVKG